MLPQKRVSLHRAIKELRLSQREVAYTVGIRESRLSGILRGWKSPTLDEVTNLSFLLGKKPSELFPELRV